MPQPKRDPDDVIPGNEPPSIFELAAIRRACSPRRDEIIQALSPNHFETRVRKDAWRLATQDGPISEAEIFVKLCALKHDNEMAYKTAFGDEIVAMVEENYPTDIVVRKIIEGSAERLKRDVGARLGSGSITPAQAVDELERLPETILGDPQESGLAPSTMLLRESLARPEVNVRLFFHGGGFPRGYYSVIHGHGGLGKTRLLCDMIVRRLLNRPWLGWNPTLEPFVPLLISLDMSRPAVSEILKTISHGIGGDEAVNLVSDQCYVVGSPEFTGTLYGDDAATEDAIVGVVKSRGATFLAIDSLARTNPSGVDSQEGLGPSITMLDRIATRADIAVTALHHDRKTPAGMPGDSDAAASARGPSNLIDNSRFAMNLDRHAGRIRVRFHKISFGPERDPAFFELGDTGQPKPTDSPKAIAEGNRLKVLQALERVYRPGAGASIGDIQASLRAVGIDIVKRTIQRHLSDLVEAGNVVSKGDSKATIYELCATQDDCAT
jgi:DNA-binding transcriptional ArsR family regulator